MVFTLPSLPSGLSSLLDTSPPVFYPAPAAQSKRLQSVDSPRRPRPRETISDFSSSPAAGPSRLHGQSEGLELPVSVSANDISGIWQPLPSREAARQRRQSLAGPAIASVSGLDIIDPFLLAVTEGEGLKLSEKSNRNGTPTRPAHRRSHSAVPFPVVSSNPSTLRQGTGVGKDVRVRSGHGHEHGPMGKLHEFSRNPLASISAVSLPTLAELESDSVDNNIRKDGPTATDGFEFPRRYGVGVGRSIPPSPLVKPHDRTSWKASPILSPTSPTHTPPSDLPPLGNSPNEYESSLMIDMTSTMSISSVPPPAQAQPQLQSMPQPSTHAASPTTTRRHRPPLSPRSWTFQDINQPFTTKITHDRRASIDSNTSVSLSDVAVLAKWSFPSSPDKGPNPELLDVMEAPRGRQPGPSDRLRERLRSLSALETASLPASSSAPSMSGSTISATRFSASQSVAYANANSGGGGGRAGPIKPSRPLTSYLTSNHRHTHSSPNLLQIPGMGYTTPPSQKQQQQQQTSSHMQTKSKDGEREREKGSMGPPLFPPPRPQRRPTTSRLRQPTPLSMPIRPCIGRHISHTSLISLSGVGAGGTGTGIGMLSSSPGSMVSDSSSILCPSPTSSVKSLPISISSTDLTLPDLENSSNRQQTQTQTQTSGKGKGKAWWVIPGLGRSRSHSRNSIKSDEGYTCVKEITSTTSMYGSDNGDTQEEAEEEEEETFIDMDQM